MAVEQPTRTAGRDVPTALTRYRAMANVVGVLLVALGAAVTAGSWLLLVADPRGRRRDNALMHAVAARFAGTQATFLDLLHLVSTVSVGIALLVMAVVAVARRRPGAAAAAVVLVLGAEGVTQALKTVLPREGPTENSLPSGHVTAIAALVLAALIVLPPALRWLAALPGLAVVGVAST